MGSRDGPVVEVPGLRQVRRNDLHGSLPRQRQSGEEDALKGRDRIHLLTTGQVGRRMPVFLRGIL
jgi:hypothetical protein